MESKVRRRHRMPFGAELTATGEVRFRLWAPAARRVEVLLADEPVQALAMEALPGGWFALSTDAARTGSRYRFRIDGQHEVADPASRCNPQGVHGASAVVDPAAYPWDDADWQAPPWHERGDLRAARRHLQRRGHVRRCHCAPAAPGASRRDRHRADAARRLSRAARLGLRRRAAVRPARRLWHARRAQGAHRRRARRAGSRCCSTSSTTTSVRRAITCTCTRRSSSTRHARRRGARRSTSTARTAARCATSSSTTRSTGSRSTTSTGCGSMRCTPSTTTASRTSSTSSRTRRARARAASARSISRSKTTTTQPASSAPRGPRRPATRSGTTTCTTACTCC